MKDFFGNELQVGDKVAFMTPQYRFMVMGEVDSFTPMKIRINYVNTWNFKPKGLHLKFLANPDQVIKKV